MPPKREHAYPGAAAFRIQQLGSGTFGQRGTELSARSDPELGEHLAQVPLDGVRADEQLGTDFVVREPTARETRDMCFLGRENVVRCDGAFADRRACGEQFASSTLRERLRPHLSQHLVGDAQLNSGVDAAVLAAQPLAVDQTGPGELHPDVRIAKQLDGLTIQSVRERPVAHQSTNLGRGAASPRGPGGLGHVTDCLNRLGCVIRSAETCRCLHELDHRLDGEAHFPWVLAAALGGRSEEHTSELQSRRDLVCRLLLEKKKKKQEYRFLAKKKKKKNRIYV